MSDRVWLALIGGFNLVVFPSVMYYLNRRWDLRVKQWTMANAQELARLAKVTEATQKTVKDTQEITTAALEELAERREKEGPP